MISSILRPSGRKELLDMRYLTLNAGDSLEIGEKVSVKILGNSKETFRVCVQTPKGFTVTQKRKTHRDPPDGDASDTIAKELVADIPLDEICRDKALMNAFLSEMFLAVANANSREKRRQRQAEGIAAAKARGVRFGRRGPPLPDNFDEIRRAWRNREFNILRAAELCGMPKSTFLSAVQRAEEAEEMQEEGEEEDAAESQRLLHRERTRDAIRHHSGASVSNAGAGGAV